MEVKNRLTPNEAQLKAFMESGDDAPIHMVNLLKFREKAEYADGRASALTGEEAYGIYGEAVAGLLVKHGGGLMFSGKVEHLLLGEVEELWDSVAIAMYPSRKAMLEMIASPEYQEIAVHREAGLAGQLNIETVNPKGLWLMQDRNG